MKRTTLALFLSIPLLIVGAGIAAATMRHGSASAAAQAQTVFTQGKNLWLMNKDGSGAHLFATAKGDRTFPWYSWSPDGRYLLVVRSVPNAAASDLLLYDAAGNHLRTLVRRAPWAGFYPSWAANADRVAYGAGTCASVHLRSSACPHTSDKAVFSVDVNGKTKFIGSYPSAGGGCGGGVADPAGDLYRIETDFGVTMPQLHWTAGHTPSFLGVMGYVPAWSSPKLSAPYDIAVSSTGVTAATIQRCSGNACTQYVVLLDPSTGHVLHTIGEGEMPVWSPDGVSLYFTHRIPGRTITLHDSDHNTIDSRVFVTEIWRAESSGANPTRLLSEPAYGLGPLSIASDGHSIVFSRIDNDLILWQNRLAGNSYNSHLLKLYGPQVALQRLDLQTGAVTALISDAGRPALQPAS